jgi:hypothetical protein
MSKSNFSAEDLIGPSDNYAAQLNPPKNLGMSSSPDALASNIAGIMTYVDVLVEGGGRGTKDGKPLGTRSFLKTFGKCKVADKNDSENGEYVSRSTYVDNVPHGEIPFLKEAGIPNLTSFEGLIPAILGKIDTIAHVPLDLMNAILEDPTPDCMKVTLKTKDGNEVVKNESGYLPISEIKRIYPCAFSGNKNVITGEVCTEPFISANENLRKQKTNNKIVINDPINKYFLAGFSGLLLYLTYKLYTKINK